MLSLGLWLCNLWESQSRGDWQLFRKYTGNREGSWDFQHTPKIATTKLLLVALPADGILWFLVCLFIYIKK